MNIAVFGFSGFIGSHLIKLFCKSHNLIKINTRDINYKLSENEIFNYFENNLIKPDVIINCCASINPKSKNDIFINENLSKIIQKYVIKKKLNTHFYHLSSINVLINDRMDRYTLSKINAEKDLVNNFTSIVRLPLIVNSDDGKKGDLDIFYKYLNLKVIPIFPMIYPGNIYRPIEVQKLCNFLLKILNNQKKLSIYNLMGKEKKNLWELYELVANVHSRKVLKINTLFLNKVLPNIIKKNIFKKNSFLSQFLSIDQSIINEKNIIYL